MKAIVLAAGYATRMYPLTRDRAKPLLEVGGRPILTHLASRIAALDRVSELIVVGNARFAADLRAWAAGFECRPRLRVLDDGSTGDAGRLGAIGDLAFALREAPLGGEDLLVAAGDNLIDFDLAPPTRAFEARGRTLLLVRALAPGEDGSRYNEVTLGPGGAVRRFREKPAHRDGDLAAIALYWFPPAVEGWLAAYLAEGGDPDAPGHFIAWLAGREPVRALPLPGPWYDIGDLDSLERARRTFRA